MLGACADADDAAQEALVRALRHGDGLRRAEAADAWIRTIAHREALRIAGRRRPASELDDELTGPDHRDRLLGDLDLRTALRTLSPRDRRIVFGHYFEDASCAELAAALDIPEGTVKVRLHRSRHALAKVLDG